MTKSSKVIGEGSYGCVHKPSLKCSDKKLSYKDKISKIMLTSEAISELKEYAVISNVDKTNDFYLGVPEKCKVKQSQYTIKSISKCKRLNRKKRITSKKQLHKMSLLILQDGGLNLSQFVKKIDKMVNTPKNYQFIKKFWIECHRLFRGIYTFQKHDIIHHDIKPQNIVYNQKYNRLNFIDFGHMRNVKTEMGKSKKSDNWIYESPFWNYPPEIQFLNRDEYIHFSNKTIKERQYFFDRFIDDLKDKEDTKFVTAFRIFLDYIVENKKEDNEIRDKYLFDLHKMMIDQIQEDNYETFLEKSIRTIDVYGLGMSLQFVLSHCRQFLEKHTVESLEDCFFHMITPNLLQRYTIEQSMDQYESVLLAAGFLEDFGIQFENHEPISTTIGKLPVVEKQIKRID